MRKAEVLTVGAAGSLVGFLAGLFHYMIIHHIFWDTGPYLYDMGLFNYILGPNSIGLNTPSTFGWPNFFYIHISPILIPFSSASYLLGLKDSQPIELVLVLAAAAAAAVAFLTAWLFLRPLGQRASIALAVVFGLAFSISGIMRGISDYPHYEGLYVSLAGLSLILIFHRHLRYAWLAFIACLLVREDAGLNMACILGAYLALSVLSERRLPARTGDLAPFLVVGLIYPFAALWIRSAMLPIESSFARVYSGSPAYAHLTPGLLLHRLDVLTHSQIHVLMTLAVSLIPFFFRPRWSALTGFVASMPWLLLNVTAVSDNAGTLMVYYPFPFLAACLASFVVTADLPDPKAVYVDEFQPA